MISVIEQTFINPLDEPIDALYLFQLYGVNLDLTCEVSTPDGKSYLIETSVEERKAAHDRYEQYMA